MKYLEPDAMSGAVLVECTKMHSACDLGAVIIAQCCINNVERMQEPDEVLTDG